MSRNLVLLVVVLVFLPLSSARAKLVTFAYQGTIESFSTTPGVPPEPFEALLGETMRVDFTFESDTPADELAGMTVRPGFGYVGQYVGAITGATVTVGSPESPLLQFTSGSPFGSIGVGSPSAYFVFIDRLDGGPPVADLPVLAFIMGFNGPDTPLDPDILPETPPDPGAFSSAVMTLDFAQTEFSPLGRLEAHDLRVVPEPGTAALLGISALWLGGRSRRRRRHRVLGGEHE